MLDAAENSLLRVRSLVRFRPSAAGWLARYQVTTSSKARPPVGDRSSASNTTERPTDLAGVPVDYMVAPDGETVRTASPSSSKATRNPGSAGPDSTKRKCDWSTMNGAERSVPCATGPRRVESAAKRPYCQANWTRKFPRLRRSRVSTSG